jgi:Aerotolerance regulator N-terminal
VSFLALGTAAMAGVALATLAVIGFLYWLKPPPQRVVVPSMFIWVRVLKERKRRSDFWRWLVSLLMALAAGLAIAAAFGRPEIEALSGRARRIAVVVDDSPTMGARTATGGTRFERAVDLARGLLSEGSAGSEYLVTDTAGRLVGTELTDRRAALERLEGLHVSLDEATAFPAADPTLFSDPSIEVYFITDGVMIRTVPAGVKVVSVFEPVDNVGITAFDLRPVPAEPNRFEAFLELANRSDKPKRVALQIEGAGGAAIEHSIDLTPGQVLASTFDLDRFSSGPLRALIYSPDDGYELDDVAYGYLGTPRQVRVRLVTSGNSYLETLLPLDPRVVLEVVPLEQAMPGEGETRPDLFVFDRFAPETPPAAPSLFIRPPARSWLPASGGSELTKLSLAGTERLHPLMDHVSLDDVAVEKAIKLTRGDSQVVAGSDDEPLILVGDAPVRFIDLAFALTDTNFPFQSSFPVFLANAVGWLAGTEVVASNLGTVAVPVTRGSVTDIAGGKGVPARASGDRTSFAPAAPGLYAVKGRDREMVVSANLLSPRVSAVNDSVLKDQPPAPGVARATASGAFSELWVGLVLFALVLILVEWWTYHRRITV